MPGDNLTISLYRAAIVRIAFFPVPEYFICLVGCSWIFEERPQGAHDGAKPLHFPQRLSGSNANILDKAKVTGSRQSDCLSEITQADSMDNLRQFLFEFCSIYGLANAVFHVTQIAAVLQQNPLILLTYPPEWVETYVARDYFSIDPVVQAGRVGFLPFDWSSLDLTSPQTASLFREAETFDVGRYGVTLVIRGPHGERSLFTVTSNLRGSEWEKLRGSIIGDLQVIAYYLHEQSLILSGLREQGVGRRLSKREAQCLELLAQGMLPKQITSRLGISESAVRLYLSSSRRKLHVGTTNQAIAKAISLELIKN